MSINITSKKENEINEAYAKLRTNKHTGLVNERHNIRVSSPHIIINHMGVCDINEIRSLIAELTDMQKAIEETTGIC